MKRISEETRYGLTAKGEDLYPVLLEMFVVQQKRPENHLPGRLYRPRERNKNASRKKS